MRHPAATRIVSCVCAAVGLIAAGCSDDDAPQTSSDPAEFAAQELESSATSEDPSSTSTSSTPEEDTLPTDVPGAPLNEFELQIGDCFDQFDVLVQGRPDTVTSEFPCDDPHGFEVYDTFTHPAEHPSVYPGESVMRNYATQLCYRSFEEWVGAEYEVSALEIGVLIPPRDFFEDDRRRYRGIHCWVYRTDGEPMVGTSRGSAW